MERTYVMLKPDCVKRNLIGEVIARIERRGYKITAMKMFVMSEELLREHYCHIADKPFFPETISYMTSGPVVALIVEGQNVVEGVRLLMGPTKFGVAQPGSIRGDYATDTGYNLIHGSDSAESAEIEIKRFFGDKF